jgi:serine/threonine-protein kinase
MAIKRDAPPLYEAGAIAVALDSEGRLLEFRGRPAASKETAPPADWNRLFAFAGLDPKALVAAETRWTPEMACDAQAAWKGVWPGRAADELHVEAGAYRGQPVYFRVSGPWSGQAQPEPVPAAFLVVFCAILPIVAARLAWKNARLGRSDRRGAFRSGCFVFATQWVAHFFKTGHSFSLTEILVNGEVLSVALSNACLFGVMYMALEPYVRRRWPQVLVSWNRLLSGNFRDPLMGGHALIGALLGVIVAVLWGIQSLVTTSSPSLPLLALQQAPVPPASLIGFRMMVSIGGGFGYVLLLTIVRFIVRREWVAFPLVLGITLIAFMPAPGPAFTVRVLLTAAMIGVQLWVLVRLGLFPLVVSAFTIGMLRASPLTSDLSAWYAKDAVIAIGIVVGIALYGFRATLAGRPLWRDELAGG